MTRIVAGSAKGRQLRVPKSGTRPTSERVREAIFSALEHRGYVQDASVLDLYAGSGALGLEAASRGAARVVCVEASASACKLIAANARETRLSAVTVVNKKVESYLALPPTTQFDLVMLDPPYDVDGESLAQVLVALEPYLVEDALVLVERSRRSGEPNWPAFLGSVEERKMGDTRVWSAYYEPNSNSIEA